MNTDSLIHFFIEAANGILVCIVTYIFVRRDYKLREEQEERADELKGITERRNREIADLYNRYEKLGGEFQDWKLRIAERYLNKEDTLRLLTDIKEAIKQMGTSVEHIDSRMREFLSK